MRHYLILVSLNFDFKIIEILLFLKWLIEMVQLHLVYQFFILYYLFRAHICVGFDQYIEHLGDIYIFDRNRILEEKPYILEPIEQLILWSFFSCSSFKLVSLFLWYWVYKIQGFGNKIDSKLTKLINITVFLKLLTILFFYRN